uniref:Zinc finger protein 385B n=1 Tax=Scophthalmus maximus TaxID=52904 RepID=A0A8D2ZUK0_SCOMX
MAALDNDPDPTQIIPSRHFWHGQISNVHKTNLKSSREEWVKNPKSRIKGPLLAPQMGGALPGLIGATGPSVMMKPFLSYSVETTSPVGLFPNFNTMDPVQKAVINHTFGVTMVPKKKQVISCNVCQLRFNSDVKKRLTDPHLP